MFNLLSNTFMKCDLHFVYSCPFMFFHSIYWRQHYSSMCVQYQFIISRKLTYYCTESIISKGTKTVIRMTSQIRNIQRVCGRNGAFNIHPNPSRMAFVYIISLVISCLHPMLFVFLVQDVMYSRLTNSINITSYCKANGYLP